MNPAENDESTSRLEVAMSEAGNTLHALKTQKTCASDLVVAEMLQKTGLAFLSVASSWMSAFVNNELIEAQT